MQVVGSSMNEVYRVLCQAIYLRGEDVMARGLMTRELTNVEIVLENPRDRIVSSRVRAMSMRYMTGEICFYLDRAVDLERIAFYGPFWRKVSDDGQRVRSAYGDRLFTGQFVYAINTLEADKYSRKAVMPIYNPNDALASKDNPCTMFLQLMIRNDRLDCHVFMRSNDVWLGLPYDAAFFTFLQEIALVILRQTYPELQMGTYYHHATSLHCYNEHIDALWDVKNEWDLPPVVMPEVTIDDVYNWFYALLEEERGYRQHGQVPFDLPGVQGWFAQWLR